MLPFDVKVALAEDTDEAVMVSDVDWPSLTPMRRIASPSVQDVLNGVAAEASSVAVNVAAFTSGSGSGVGSCFSLQDAAAERSTRAESSIE